MIAVLPKSTDQYSDAPAWRPAKTGREWKKLMKMSPADTPGLIRSHEHWAEYVRRAETHGGEHPLRELDSKLLHEFGESLVFRNGGLAGARYGELAERLSFRRFRGLFGQFGIDLGLLQAWDNKYCAERATCRTEYAAVCTDNC
jgi:hypothetical protein